MVELIKNKLYVTDDEIDELIEQIVGANHRIISGYSKFVDTYNSVLVPFPRPLSNRELNELDIGYDITMTTFVNAYRDIATRKGKIDKGSLIWVPGTPYNNDKIYSSMDAQTITGWTPSTIDNFLRWIRDEKLVNYGFIVNDDTFREFLEPIFDADFYRFGVMMAQIYLIRTLASDKDKFKKFVNEVGGQIKIDFNKGHYSVILPKDALDIGKLYDVNTEKGKKKLITSLLPVYYHFSHIYDTNKNTFVFKPFVSGDYKVVLTSTGELEEKKQKKEEKEREKKEKKAKEPSKRESERISKGIVLTPDNAKEVAIKILADYYELMEWMKAIIGENDMTTDNCFLIGYRRLDIDEFGKLRDDIYQPNPEIVETMQRKLAKRNMIDFIITNEFNMFGFVNSDYTLKQMVTLYEDRPDLFYLALFIMNLQNGLHRAGMALYHEKSSGHVSDEFEEYVALYNETWDIIIDMLKLSFGEGLEAISNIDNHLQIIYSVDGKVPPIVEEIIGFYNEYIEVVRRLGKDLAHFKEDVELKEKVMSILDKEDIRFRDVEQALAKRAKKMLRKKLEERPIAEQVRVYREEAEKKIKEAEELEKTSMKVAAEIARKTAVVEKPLKKVRKTNAFQFIIDHILNVVSGTNRDPDDAKFYTYELWKMYKELLGEGYQPVGYNTFAKYFWMLKKAIKLDDMPVIVRAPQYDEPSESAPETFPGHMKHGYVPYIINVEIPDDRRDEIIEMIKAIKKNPQYVAKGYYMVVKVEGKYTLVKNPATEPALKEQYEEHNEYMRDLRKDEVSGRVVEEINSNVRMVSATYAKGEGLKTLGDVVDLIERYKEAGFDVRNSKEIIDLVNVVFSNTMDLFGKVKCTAYTYIDTGVILNRSELIKASEVGSTILAPQPLKIVGLSNVGADIVKIISDLTYLRQFMPNERAGIINYAPPDYVTVKTIKGFLYLDYPNVYNVPFRLKKASMFITVVGGSSVLNGNALFAEVRDIGKPAEVIYQFRHSRDVMFIDSAINEEMRKISEGSRVCVVSGSQSLDDAIKDVYEHWPVGVTKFIYAWPFRRVTLSSALRYLFYGESASFEEQIRKRWPFQS